MPSEHLRALTGLRIIAAIWVVLLHLQPVLAASPLGGLRDPIANSGYLAVDRFFVLSGFIITIRHARDFATVDARQYRDFLLLRLARIYPAHVVAIVLVGLLALASTYVGFAVEHPEKYEVSALLRHLTLTYGWTASSDLTWNLPAWTVSLEWLAYLVFPILLVCLRPLGRNRRLGWGLALAISTVAAIAATAGATGGSLNLFRILGAFTAGVAIGHLWISDRPLAAKWNPVLCDISLVGMFVGAVIAESIDPGRSAYLIVPVGLIVVTALAHGLGRAGQVLSHPVLVAGGEISFAIYLIHALVISVLSKILPPESMGPTVTILVVPVYFSSIFGAAILLHLLVERPARLAIRAHLRRGFPADYASQHR